MEQILVKFIDFLEKLEEQCKRNIASKLVCKAFIFDDVFKELNISRGERKELSDEDRNDLFELQDVLSVCHNLSNLLREYMEGKATGSIFCNFYELSAFLYSSNLTIREQFKVLLYLLDANYKMGVFSDRILGVNASDVMEHNFDTISSEDALIYLLNPNQSPLYLKKNDELSLTEREQLKELNKYAEDHFITPDGEYSDFIRLHHVLLEHYFDNLGHITAEDKEIIITAFINLGMIEPFIKNISGFIKVSKKMEIKKGNGPIYIKSDKHYIGEKEYREIKHQLRDYFDFYHMQYIRDLTDEEIINCVDLLNSIEASPYQIIQFLNVMNRKREEEGINNTYKYLEANPLSLYNLIYEKLISNKNDWRIFELLGEMEYCIQNMLIPESNEMYEYFREELKRLLRKSLDSLNNDASVEVTEAKLKLGLI